MGGHNSCRWAKLIIKPMICFEALTDRRVDQSAFSHATVYTPAVLPCSSVLIHSHTASRKSFVECGGTGGSPQNQVASKIP